MLTEKQLQHIMPNALSANIGKYLPYLNEYMPRYGISTPLRQQHFIAQIAQESGELRYSEEIASGKAYDTGRKAVELGNTPRADGDGQKYKGRGLIQVTGTANYKRFNKAIGGDGAPDVVKHPTLLATPRYAVLSACWFFKTAGCLALADKDDVGAVTKKVNGGLNGFDQRKMYLKRAKEVIK